VQFHSNDPREVIHDAVPIDEVPDLTPDRYQPRGFTPLLDALGAGIGADDARLERVGHREDQIVSSFTDGLENASYRWDRARLFKLVTGRTSAGWTLVSMGANQEFYAEAGGLGIDRGSAQDFRVDRRGVGVASADMNRPVRRYRVLAGPARLDSGTSSRGRRSRRPTTIGGTSGLGSDQYCGGGCADVMCAPHGSQVGSGTMVKLCEDARDWDTG